MLLLRQKMADHIAIIQQEKDDGFPETGFHRFSRARTEANGTQATCLRRNRNAANPQSPKPSIA